MIRSRFFFAAACAAVLAGCGDYGVPPAQNYATVAGTVTDASSGQPIGGATVTVDSVLTVTTTADGAFKLTNVPPGPFDYAASADGYQPATGSGTATVGTALTLDLRLGK
jgi:hypothetical protein